MLSTNAHTHTHTLKNINIKPQVCYSLLPSTFKSLSFPPHLSRFFERVMVTSCLSGRKVKGHLELFLGNNIQRQLLSTSLNYSDIMLLKSHRAVSFPSYPDQISDCVFMTCISFPPNLWLKSDADGHCSSIMCEAALFILGHRDTLTALPATFHSAVLCR